MLCKQSPVVGAAAHREGTREHRNKGSLIGASHLHLLPPTMDSPAEGIKEKLGPMAIIFAISLFGELQSS